MVLVVDPFGFFAFREQRTGRGLPVSSDGTGRSETPPVRRSPAMALGLLPSRALSSTAGSFSIAHLFVTDKQIRFLRLRQFAEVPPEGMIIVHLADRFRLDNDLLARLICPLAPGQRFGLQFRPGFQNEKGEHLSDSKCKRPLWKACSEAGLDRKVGWHVLRHTFASHLVMNGVSLKTVQDLLGHTDIKTTLRYMHLNPKVRRDAVQTLNSLGTIWAQNENPPRLRVLTGGNH